MQRTSDLGCLHVCGVIDKHDDAGTATMLVEGIKIRCIILSGLTRVHATAMTIPNFPIFQQTFWWKIVLIVRSSRYACDIWTIIEFNM